MPIGARRDYSGRRSVRAFGAPKDVPPRAPTRVRSWRWRRQARADEPDCEPVDDLSCKPRTAAFAMALRHAPDPPNIAYEMLSSPMRYLAR